MKSFILTTLFILLTSCSTTDEIFEDITAPDYVSSSKARKLEIPPDLSEIDSNNAYEIPGEAKSYKNYLDKQNNNSNIDNDTKKIIADPDGMKIIKSGTLRWLIVEKEPDILWPHIKDFWEEIGFRVVVANKRTGIIETEWTDSDDIKLDQNSDAISRFDKWLDNLSGFADKRKFRTRVEVGENGSTEIFVSQRSLDAIADQHERILKTRQSGYNPTELYKIEGYIDEDGKKTSKTEVRENDDYEIDSEILTRLMIKLGAVDFDARKKIANPETLVKAKLVERNNSLYIKMLDPYDRSWRRLGLAIDIMGMVTEDKDRSKGIYYVRYSEQDLPEKKEDEEEGIIDKLMFWSDDKEQDKNSTNEKNVTQIESGELETNEESYTGIEAPEVKPIDEDLIPEEFINDDFKKDKDEEETWLTNLWPTWGGQEESKSLPSNEKRFRIRIKPTDKYSEVYIDYPNEKINNSKEAKRVLSFLFEYLK